MTDRTAIPAPPIALWVVPVADVGGVARHVLDALTTGIPGWRAVLLCPPGPLADRAAALGVAVLTGAVSPADGIPTGVAELRRIAGTLRPAVVHSHLAYADLLAALASLALPVALVTTEHGIAGDDLVYHGARWRSRLKALAHAGRLRRADALIAVSHSTLDVVRAKWHPTSALRTVVIPNGVDPLPEPAQVRPGLRVLSLARFAPEKGLSDLVRAFALVARDHPEARLTLAGRGPLEAEVRALVSSLDLEDRVTLPGQVDPVAALSSADVLAQLSLWENCSYSILDALVHGLGVVATPVGGNPELVPAACLVAAEDHRGVADLLVTQGLDPKARPALPSSWPTMAHMCEAIGRVYREVRR